LHSRGFALMEAMVSIVIFSVGVLGLVGLQSAMSKAQGALKYRADASYLATELLGTMWGDRVNLARYAGTSCASYARCSEWMAKVGRVLPNGSAAVAVTGGQVTVTLTWRAPADGSHSYTTVTAINT
jgi:type IV pilus assembly protein PilV